MGYTDKIEKALNSMSDLMCELASDVQHKANSVPEEVARHLAEHMTHSDEQRIASYIDIQVDARDIAEEFAVSEIAEQFSASEITKEVAKDVAQILTSDDYFRLRLKEDLIERKDFLNRLAQMVIASFASDQVADMQRQHDAELKAMKKELTELRKAAVNQINKPTAPQPETSSSNG